MSNQMYQQPYAQAPGATEGAVPGEVYQQAEMQRLGSLIRVFKPTSIWVALAISAGVLILDLGLMFALWLADRISIYLLIVPIFLIVYVVNAIRSNNHKAYLYQEGFIYANGSQLHAVRWDHVEAVWQKQVSYSIWSTRSTYTVKRPDGAQVVISSHVHKVRELGDAILNEVTKRHLPLAQQVYNSGAPVPFGNLSIGMQGIGFRDKLLPWPEVKDVVIVNGQVQVKRQGNMINFATVQVADVPNLPVMMQLVANGLRSVPPMR
ncbi:DUF6585 family protein [Ktedonospora formicarum]|uniref:Uncharacterized protein n=1 Tax=Ktedonospora formicarum TaxID=2778364 RepID=A0A8J3HYU9_9CHLR|nr:DUF6585 family protein [Ktedonospora formicarum]GHO44491.1 hypothetical protein KSX_26540 [Ktedonospora formicarum]